MKKTPTFQEQYDKVVFAYHAGLLNPFCKRHCFIAHLLGNKLWGSCDELYDIDGVHTALNLQGTADVIITKNAIYKGSQGLYELEEVMKLESNFLNVLNAYLTQAQDADMGLYMAMISTVKLLKEFHEAKGETAYYEPITRAKYKYVKLDGADYTIIREGGIESLVMALFGIKLVGVKEVRPNRDN